MNNDSRYIFILGSMPALSLAELHFLSDHAAVQMQYQAWNNTFALVDTPMTRAEHLALSARLGGMVKIAQVFREAPSLSPVLILSALPRSGFKIYFGVSVYDLSHRHRVESAARKLGIEVKRLLKKEEIPSRLVTSRGTTLSSVIVRTNKLLTERGAEILVVALNKERYVYGKTFYAQPYESFALRDIGRPRRDMRSGMLPPKLARMMINIATGYHVDNAELLDPFCGSGTVLQEAVLLGVPRICGSDRDSEAIQHTSENLQWLVSRAPWQSLSSVHPRVLAGDARAVHEIFRHERFSAIVTEPYLGPPRSRSLRDVEIEALREELSSLYIEALTSCAVLLRPGGRVVIVWPFWRTQSGSFAFIELIQECARLGLRAVAPLPSALQSSFDVEEGYHPSRRSLLYYREGQTVMREIRIFEKA